MALLTAQQLHTMKMDEQQQQQQQQQWIIVFRLKIWKQQ